MTDDPREAAATELHALLERARRGPLAHDECLHAADRARLVPGLLRQVASALSAQRDPAAVDGLRALPASVPGVVEGLYGAVTSGITRARRDGRPAPALLAMDFRRSKAKSFTETLDRARAVFGPGLEILTVGGRTHYRFMLREGRGTLAGRTAAAAHDVQWLHGRLSKLRGSRLWLNGWRFAEEDGVRPAAQVHLVRGWLSWAASQTQTLR